MQIYQQLSLLYRPKHDTSDDLEVPKAATAIFTQLSNSNARAAKSWGTMEQDVADHLPGVGFRHKPTIQTAEPEQSHHM